MTRPVRSNPEWSDAVAKTYCGPLYAFSDKYGLPSPKLDNRCAIDGELGEGAYGAVYETEKSGVVFKITSDDSEAKAIGAVIEMENAGMDFKGLVHFRAVRKTENKHDGRPVYFIWREEVVRLGGTWALPARIKTALFAFLDEADKLLRATDRARCRAKPDVYWKLIENSVKKALDSEADLGNDRFAMMIDACLDEAHAMRTVRGAEYIAETLIGLIAAGVVLADVHTHNVGKVRRGGHLIWVVTDPGNAVFLDRTLAELEIPLLKG